MLTTFQRPLADSYKSPPERPPRSIMKTSLSLDDLDDQKSSTITFGRSKSHDRQQLGERTASNVSINVDSGEQVLRDLTICM